LGLGQVMNLLRECEIVLIPYGEYVYKKGDLAIEMYFIIEGLVQVRDEVEMD
jgi:CRP-like cAMP-binding protein